MMSPKRIEEMKRIRDDVMIGKITPWAMAQALKDAIAEIEELQAKLNPKPATEPGVVRCCTKLGCPEIHDGCAARGHE